MGEFHQAVRQRAEAQPTGRRREVQPGICPAPTRRTQETAAATAAIEQERSEAGSGQEGPKRSEPAAEQTGPEFTVAAESKSIADQPEFAVAKSTAESGGSEEAGQR